MSLEKEEKRRQKMSHMKKMQSEKQNLIKFWKNLSRKVRVLPIVCVSALSLSQVSCVTSGAPVLKPPACPLWSDYALDDLEMILSLQEAGDLDIESLEYQLGENQRHCEALDAFLEDE